MTNCGPLGRVIREETEPLTWSYHRSGALHLTELGRVCKTCPSREKEEASRGVPSRSSNDPGGMVLYGPSPVRGPIMVYRTLKTRVSQRQVLTRHIMEQAEKYGYRCPATQKPLNAFRSVLIKVHSPTPEWCVVDAYAYDCAEADGTMDKIRQETNFRVEVIDGRTL